MARKDITGTRFGRLIALHEDGRNKHGQKLWACACDCGNSCTVPRYCLTSGNTKSCGCLMRETSAETARQINLSHGMSGTSEYRCWEAMIRRCTNPASTDFKNYGARGIKVCEAWRESFEAFYAHMGPKPLPSHSIDRFPDVNGDYQPGNCRWATRTEQARNRRSNRIVELDGEQMSLAEAAERADVSYNAAKKRINRGLDVEGEKR